MSEPPSSSELPEIPEQRYFTIGEVSELCGVKPHVLRYWEQEFPPLKPIKRRGNRRFYTRDDIILIRRLRRLLYERGFTIGGARQHLLDQEAEGALLTRVMALLDQSSPERVYAMARKYDQIESLQQALPALLKFIAELEGLMQKHANDIDLTSKQSMGSGRQFSRVGAAR